MKKQSIVYGLMIMAGSLLFSSCSSKEAAKSETDKVSENNNTEANPDNPADTTMNISESAETKKETGAGEKEENEENEENEKEDKD